MRGRVAVPLFLLLLLPLPLSAQCNFSLAYSGPFRASYLDVAVEGNDLWAATSYGVQLFDRSVDPPALVASVAVPGITRVVRAVNGVAFAGSGSSVYAIHRSGKTLSIAGSYDAGAAVNDLVVTPAQYLYIATANGLREIDFLNPGAPIPLVTSGSNVTSLAADANLTTLYAADGDSTIEVFNITVATLPQHTGSLDSLPHVIAVELTPTRLYASDGFSTDVFVANAKTANIAAGTVSLATLTGDVVFAAGNDRRIRAVDWSTIGAPVDLFGTDLVPSGGTIYRAGGMRIAGGRLYVAGGDAGLLTFDISSMAAPFPVRSYPNTAMTSTAWVDGKLYASRNSGGLAEFTKNASGTLTQARQWDARTHTVHDGSGGLLLTSSGSTLFYWTLISSTPVLVTSATLRAAVVSAVVNNGTAYAVLADKSVWSVDVTAAAPVPQQIANAKATTIAHSGNVIATSYDPGDGTTVITFYTTRDLSDPAAVTIPGTSTTPLALSGNTAAAFTFNGINLIDATTRAVTTIPGSGSAIAKRLAISGTRVFELTNASLLIWDIASKKLTRTMLLPAEANSLSIDTMAGMATATGVETAAFDSTEAPPTLLATRNSNTYYRKAVAGADRLYLFGTNSIDVFETRYGFVPHYLTGLRSAGVLDVAANDTGLFTLSSGGAITAYSREGGVIAQTTLDASSQPLAIVTAGNAVWVAVSRGCTAGGCEKKTLVLNAATLATTATLDGGVVDAVTSGTSVSAIFDLPAEVRLYSNGSLIRSVAAPGITTPVSITVTPNFVYVAGERLYLYDAQLTQHGDRGGAFQPDPSGPFTIKDQRVHAENGCAFISRGVQPEWDMYPLLVLSRVPVPAVVRSVASTPGRFYLLTDDSLEIWALDTTATQPPRRRAAGH
jgi:hypothetical protein